MSAKQRVYQGVRVKTTVKELLQRHRAQEANCKILKTHTSQAYLELQDLCASTFQSRHVPPHTFALTDASSYCARALPLRTDSLPVPDGSCNFQMQTSTFNDTQLQFRDVMLPGNGYGGSNNSSSGGINYNPSLPPPPTSSPLPWCHAPTSEADYYGHGMALCSSSESLTHCNPLDHNSYSPHDSFSSSSSSCYNSPTRLEPSYHGLTSEQPHDLFCPPMYWPGQEESFPAPEYAPYYNPTDYPYACPVEDNYFRRDFPMSSEMCYNVL